MINFIFDIDDTLIIHPTDGVLSYNKIDINKNLNFFLDANINNNINNYIYTNGTYSHADEVLNKLNNKNLFKKIYARDTIPYMKPDIRSFIYVMNDIDNNNINIFFDDRLDNMKTAKDLGWVTIWINPDSSNYFFDFIDYYFKDINDALNKMNFILYNLINNNLIK